MHTQTQKHSEKHTQKSPKDMHCGGDSLIQGNGTGTRLTFAYVPVKSFLQPARDNCAKTTMKPTRAHDGGECPGSRG